MSKIAPCLWFAREAEEAANFYVSLFPDSRIDHVQKNTVDMPSQIVPAVLRKYIADPDPAKAARVMRAWMGMVKLDIAALEAAYRG